MMKFMQHFLWAGLTVVLFGAVSCGGDMHHDMAGHAGHTEHAEHAGHAGHEHHHHEELEADPGLPGESIYQLSSLWQNDQTEELPLSHLAGQAVVGAMVYSSCEFACPIIVGDMKKIEAALSPEAAESTKFVLFSFDPDRDTPEVLSAYRERQDLLGDNWVTLRAPEAAVRELAVVLGVRYKKAGVDFSHSNLIIVFDESGVPQFRQQGLNNEPDEAVAAIMDLVHSTH